MTAIDADSREKVGEDTPVRALRTLVLEWLRGGMELVSSAGDGDASELAEKLERLYARLERSCFHLAVLGQFKRGKSTLVNALIGRKLLPSSVVPLTAIPTFIGYSERPQLQVVGLDGRGSSAENTPLEQIHAELEQLVTECGNPENRRQILRVELGLPLELLGTGLVLIDTPGVGSTYQHNTRTTLDFLPQCDAAVFVVSADPPLTQAELEFLEEVKDRAGRLFFVLNKSDYLDDEERRQAVDFLTRQLERAGLADTEIFCMSAKRALRAREAGDEDAFGRSGLGELERRLFRFVGGEKDLLLCRAICDKAARLVRQLLLDKQLELKALEIPVERLKSKREQFERAAESIMASSVGFGDRLAGEQKRCGGFVEEQAAGLRAEATAWLLGLLAEQLASPHCPTEAQIKAAFEYRVPQYFRRQLELLAARVAEHVEGRLAVYEAEAAELAERVRRAAAEIFEISYSNPGASHAFDLDTSVYWSGYHWTPTFSPFPPGALDAVLPDRLRRRRLEQRWKRQIEQLVMQNTETVRWQLLQSLIKAIAGFSTRLESSLEETVEAVRRAAASAMAMQSCQTERLARARTGLSGLVDRLQQWLDANPTVGTPHS